MRRRQQDRRKATAKYTSNSRLGCVQYRFGCHLLPVPIHSTIAAAKAMMFRPRQHEMRPRSLSHALSVGAHRLHARFRLVATPKKNWIDDKLPRHVSTMIHNQKVELDSIRKERNHLKKIVEDMGGIEDPYLKDMIADEMSELNDMNGNEISDLTKVSTLKGKMSNLELPDKIESSNLKKVSSLDDKVLKLELKVHQLISLLAVSWAIIVGFVAAKMM
ncbi:hypothetical protein H5410_052822 [Solanum commersonii]|uniref:Uncharacterized protein n=1 Tax=Solanum commersonii TaxID=4109 RepID=A0A9J5X261_SOLCO|nr:hypothetical protein H5410_052822 [Solanum commersonii]